MSPGLSELTPMLLNMELTHLDLEASIYTYLDGFLMVAVLLLIAVMTSRSEKRKRHRSFRVPRPELIAT